MFTKSFVRASVFTACVLCAQGAEGVCDPNRLQPGANDSLSNPRVYLVYWGWGSPFNDPYGEAPILQSYLSYIGGFRWLNIITQYGAANPQDLFLANIWVDNTNPAPPFHPTADQVSAEVTAAASHFNIANQSNSIILVALPSTTGYLLDLQGAAACGFHWFSGTTGNPYAAMAYMPQMPTYCHAELTTLGSISATAHHEISETIVNPNPATKWAWGDPTQELADKCGTCGTSGGPTCYRPCGVPAITAGVAANVSASTMQLPALYSNDANGGQGGCVYARATGADAYTLGTDHALYHSLQDFTGGTVVPGIWTNDGAPTGVQLTGDTASVSWSPYRSDIFVLDTSSVVHHAYVDNANPYCPYPNGYGYACWDDPTYGGSWGNPGGLWTLIGTPAAVSWGNGRLDVYFMAVEYIRPNTYYGIFHRALNGTALGAWTQITALPATPGFLGVGATSMGPTQIDLFYVDNNYTIRHAYNTDTSGNVFTWDVAWQTGFFSSAPAALSSQPGYIDVLLDDSSGQPIDWYSTNVVHGAGAQSEFPLGGLFNSAPGAIGMGDGRFLVAGRGTTNAGYIASYNFNSGALAGWQSMGGVLSSRVSLSAW